MGNVGGCGLDVRSGVACQPGAASRRRDCRCPDFERLAELGDNICEGSDLGRAWACLVRGQPDLPPQRLSLAEVADRRHVAADTVCYHWRRQGFATETQASPRTRQLVRQDAFEAKVITSNDACPVTGA